MATDSDFAAWAIPDLVIPLPCADGQTRKFVVHPPSVEDSKKLLASAVRGEVVLGIAPPGATISDEVQQVLDSMKDEHPSLGTAYQQMVDAGVNPTTINRMAYYCVFYWTRSKDYADAIAVLLWARESPDSAEETDAPAPKD